jgi:hypothetical protein
METCCTAYSLVNLVMVVNNECHIFAFQEIMNYGLIKIPLSNNIFSNPAC